MGACNFTDLILTLTVLWFWRTQFNCLFKFGTHVTVEIYHKVPEDYIPFPLTRPSSNYRANEVDSEDFSELPTVTLNKTERQSGTARRSQILRDGFDSRLESIAFDIHTGWLLTRRAQAHFAVSFNYC